MGRDMNNAISGMESSSSWLDVIGNNLANTSTTAYKSSRVSFADSFGDTLSAGTGDDSEEGLGGVNPQQVGAGTKVQAITPNWAQGTIQTTDITTDIAINGNGFLISKQGASTFLTRAGNLQFDSTGNLVDANGGLIQGYNATLQQSKTILDTAADNKIGGAPITITQSSLVLNNTNPGAITNIVIAPNMTMPSSATTQVTFTGNLDAGQQVNGATGGVEQMFTGPLVNQNPVLPLGLAGITLNPNDFTAGSLQPAVAVPPVPAGVLIQANNLSVAANGPQPAVTGAVTLNAVKQADAGTYAWESSPPVTPALASSETVYDSNGDPRTITVQFYQVNDIGGAGINSAAGPSQTAYAWYAFDTTGKVPVSTSNLLGGTGIIEGDLSAPPAGYDRGTTGNQYSGDLVFFNTDGSLASTGGVLSHNGLATQALPDVYLPPSNPPGVSPNPSIGSEITQIQLNFGTAGVMGTGERNGLIGDAEGAYQSINGVNTYLPSNHAVVTQNGYAQGTLTGIEFDPTGTINGTFSNEQTIALAQVAMATVRNEGGLISSGNNNYSLSVNSGTETIGLADKNGMGTIVAGSLESSNVDTAVELSNMILAQRAFEENSRVITVESQDLQTLTQL